MTEDATIQDQPGLCRRTAITGVAAGAAAIWIAPALTTLGSNAFAATGSVAPSPFSHTRGVSQCGTDYAPAAFYGNPITGYSTLATAGEVHVEFFDSTFQNDLYGYDFGSYPAGDQVLFYAQGPGTIYVRFSINGVPGYEDLTIVLTDTCPTPAGRAAHQLRKAPSVKTGPITLTTPAGKTYTVRQ